MRLLGNRVLVKREAVEDKGGFESVKAIDDFVSRGVVYMVGEDTAFNVGVGSIVIFAKFSPDTHTITVGEEDMKSVAVSDIIAVI